MDTSRQDMAMEELVSYWVECHTPDCHRLLRSTDLTVLDHRDDSWLIEYRCPECDHVHVCPAIITDDYSSMNMKRNSTIAQAMLEDHQHSHIKQTDDLNRRIGSQTVNHTDLLDLHQFLNSGFDGDFKSLFGN